MRRSFSLLAVACLLAISGCASPSAGRLSLDDEADDELEVVETEDEHGIGHKLLLWIPNRIFDVLDIVRARVKLGVGLGFTARATELADVKLGAWNTAWVGLHGPRLEPVIPWPVGLESYSGVGISVIEAESDDLLYGVGEFGLGVHALIIGLDVGVDVFEIGDFVTGLILIDFMDDDL